MYHDRIRPRLGGLPHLERFTWQNFSPAQRVTRSGRPGYPPWRVTPHKRVTSSTWGPPPPYKQVLIFPIQTTWYSPTSFPGLFPLKLGGAGLGFPPLPISMGKALGTRLDILQAIAYAYICTWMHVHKTTFERNSSPGYHHVSWKGKKTYKLKRFFFYWKSGSVKYCWRIKVHYGLGENGE